MVDQQELFERKKYLQLLLTTYCFISIYFYVHVENQSTYSASVSIPLLLTDFCFVYSIISALDTHHFLPSLAVVSAPIIVLNSISLYNKNCFIKWPFSIGVFIGPVYKNYPIKWPFSIGVFIGSVRTTCLYLLHKEVKTYENCLRFSPQDSVWIDSVVVYSREDANQNSTTKFDQEIN